MGEKRDIDMATFILQSVHAEKVAEKMNLMYGDYGKFITSKGDVGFTPFRNFKNEDAPLMLEIRTYAGAYNSALDDVAALEEDKTKLIEALKLGIYLLTIPAVQDIMKSQIESWERSPIADFENEARRVLAEVK